MVALMFGCGIFALWEVHRLEERIHTLDGLDASIIQILKADNAMARFAENLRAAVAARDPERYRRAAGDIQRQSEIATSAALSALRMASGFTASNAEMQTTFAYWHKMLPAYLGHTSRLVALGDWPAVNRRHNGQLSEVSTMFNEFVGEIDAQATAQRKTTLDHIQKAERGATMALANFTVFVIFAAVSLGFSVTRSIAVPLGELNTAARALASGDFTHRVRFKGKDEIAVVGNAFNVASSRLSELYEKVRRNEAHFRSVFENAGDPILVLSPEGRILSATPSSLPILGLTPEELCGRQIQDFVHEDDLTEQKGIIQAKPDSERTVSVDEFRWRHPEGAWRTMAAKLCDRRADPSFRGLVLNIHDITERIATEKKVRELNDELEQRVTLRTAQLETAKQLAEAANVAKGQFLANMSHEIRTPLNGIIGMTLLTLDSQLTAEQYQSLTTLLHSAESLKTLLNDILDLSKIESGKLELERMPFEVRDTIQEWVQALAFGAHQKGLEVVCDIHPAVPCAVTGDPLRLRQVMHNLLGNALKFTSHGQVVVRVTQSASEGKTFLCFEISDTGIGISPDKLEAIFDDFVQADGSTNRKYGGTGLGLGISRRLVQLMGGTLSVESTEGKGSTFRFSIEVTSATMDSNPIDRAARKAVAGVRTFVASGNEASAAMLTNLLASWGAEIEHSVRVEHGLGTKAKGWGLVVLDEPVDQSAANRFAAAHSALLNGSSTRALLLRTPLRDSKSNYPDGVRILAKPFKESDLSKTILEILTGGIGAVPATGLAPKLTDWLNLGLEVLLVEDNPVNQLVASRMIEKHGCRVVIASNGREAVALHRETTFDLIFMDLQMPEMNGLEATRLIRAAERETPRHVPIIALTANAMSGDRETCLSAGMDDYLSKPIEPNRLLEVLRRHDPKRDALDLAESLRSADCVTLTPISS